MKNFYKNYQGALGLYSVASRQYLQGRKAFDMHAVFKGLCTKVVLSLSNVMDFKVPYKAINPRE